MLNFSTQYELFCDYYVLLAKWVGKKCISETSGTNCCPCSQYITGNVFCNTVTWLCQCSLGSYSNDLGTSCIKRKFLPRSRFIIRV